MTGGGATNHLRSNAFSYGCRIYAILYKTEYWKFRLAKSIFCRGWSLGSCAI